MLHSLHRVGGQLQGADLLLQGEEGESRRRGGGSINSSNTYQQFLLSFSPKGFIGLIVG